MSKKVSTVAKVPEPIEVTESIENLDTLIEEKKKKEHFKKSELAFKRNMKTLISQVKTLEVLTMEAYNADASNKVFTSGKKSWSLVSEINTNLHEINIQNVRRRFETGISEKEAGKAAEIIEKIKGHKDRCRDLLSSLRVKAQDPDKFRPEKLAENSQAFIQSMVEYKKLNI